ncbi:hypothetical protein AWC01_00465 [Mycobacterium doricum]|uniref:Uncharacterized protein n=1 Tax=Mycolicibacterium doricum TaxID=126673 RepID=A0A1X1SYX0_9MYCO|nr:hypothetical protein AWC01_00465 [Mycolicibacterium doricum]
MLFAQALIPCDLLFAQALIPCDLLFAQALIGVAFLLPGCQYSCEAFPQTLNLNHRLRVMSS